MFITVHAATASLLGRYINHSILAFVAGLISHFILDMIPHGDEHLGKKFLGIKIKKGEADFKILALYGSIDAFFLAIFLIFLFKNFEFANTNYVIWAIIGGILPDILVAIHKLTNLRILNWFAKLHGRIHRFLIAKLPTDIPLKIGILGQICIMVALVWIIYAIR